MYSGLHTLYETTAHTLTSEMAIDTFIEEVAAADAAEVQPEPPAKAQRSREPQQPSHPPPAPQHIAGLRQAITDTLASAMRELRGGSGGSSGSGGANAGGASASGAFGAAALALPWPAFGPGDNVTVRRSELTLVFDSISRAATAARQAQRISANAARTFGDEASALDEARSALQDLLQ